MGGVQKQGNVIRSLFTMQFCSYLKGVHKSSFEGYYIATLVCELFSLLCLGVFLRTQYSCSLVCLVLLHRAVAFLGR